MSVISLSRATQITIHKLRKIRTSLVKTNQKVAFTFPPTHLIQTQHYPSYSLIFIGDFNKNQINSKQ